MHHNACLFSYGLHRFDTQGAKAAPDHVVSLKPDRRGLRHYHNPILVAELEKVLRVWVVGSANLIEKNSGSPGCNHARRCWVIRASRLVLSGLAKASEEGSCRTNGQRPQRGTRNPQAREVMFLRAQDDRLIL